MTLRMNNWCDTCEEACHDHPSLCTTCGTTLGPPPPSTLSGSNGLSASNNSGMNNFDFPPAAVRALPDGFLDDLRDANRDLNAILGSLRGQVQDLDALTRGFIQHQRGNTTSGDQWQTIPAELLNQSQLSSSHRPTAKQTLAQIPRMILDEKSTLFRHATLEVPDKSSISSSSSPSLSSFEKFLKISCVMGEFGPVGRELDFLQSPIVVCSPLTGKGGKLSSTTTHLIRQLSSHRNIMAATATTAESSTSQSQPPKPPTNQRNVLAFLQRGDDVTFVQKAMLAQEAGAAAVVIGNNTSIVWPYVMKDSKNEAQKLGLNIPVAMIKEEDFKQVLRLYKQYHHDKHRQQQHAGESHCTPDEDQAGGQGPCYMACNLRIEKSQSKDCVVCCEKLDVGDTVMQLPDCGHIFHSDCALAWLVSHNTCPYCRWELPTDDPEYERERRRQQRTHAGSSNTTLAPSEGAEAFYG